MDMTKLDARKSGSFKVGGEIEIHRLGFGAMRITGKGIWGPPEDKPEAIRTLKRLPKLGLDFVDTADSYGPDVSEQLIRETLHPYRGMLIATKAGFQRLGPAYGRWTGVLSGYARKRSRAANNSGWSRSAFGSCTASTPRCRAMNSSARSSRCSMTASSVMPA